MIDARRLAGASAVCALVAMSFPGGVNGQGFRPSAVCEAIASGNVAQAMKLVEQGADVNASHGCALLLAAQRGQLELTKLLLERKADPNRRISGDLTVVMGASSPLVAAVISRKVQMVQMLLEGGANPRDDFDAFGVVLNFSDAEMAGLLLRHGANANMTSPAERTAYAYVGPEKNRRQVEIPRRDLEPDRIDGTAKRFQCGIDTATRGSLLYLAAGRGRDRIAELLLEHKADPNARTLNGTTPLMTAASQNNLRIVTLLMNAGADVKATDRCGRTAEDYTVLYPHHGAARLAPQTRALLQKP